MLLSCLQNFFQVASRLLENLPPGWLKSCRQVGWKFAARLAKKLPPDFWLICPQAAWNNAAELLEKLPPGCWKSCRLVIKINYCQDTGNIVARFLEKSPWYPSSFQHHRTNHCLLEKFPHCVGKVATRMLEKLPPGCWKSCHLVVGKLAARMLEMSL